MWNTKNFFVWSAVAFIVMCICTQQCSGQPEANSWQDIPVITMGNYSRAELDILAKKLKDDGRQRNAHSAPGSPQPLENFSDGIFFDRGQDGVVDFSIEGNGNAIVELGIFCDMQFSAEFNFDEKAIRDYISIFIWDSALRFKSIPSSNISLHISAIILLTDPKYQDFIEMTRDKNGFIANRIHETLDLFSQYVYRWMNIDHSLPKFDVGLALTNAVERDREIGIANIGGACYSDHTNGKYYGTAIFSDRGTFRVKVATHELGHVLGAWHDFAPGYPGGCPDSHKSYIMSYNMTLDTQFYFSSCSNRLISEFVRSEQASCLKQTDGGKSGLKKIPAPPRLEQCKRFVGREDVFVDELESNICSVSKCYFKNGTTVDFVNVETVDTTPCKNAGECFRRRCLFRGFLVQSFNGATCMQATSRFESTDTISAVECPHSDESTPFQRFSFRWMDSGYQIYTPYSSITGENNGDKCVQPRGENMFLFDCTKDDEDQEKLWDIVTVGKKENVVKLFHKATGHCVKLVKGIITASTSCGTNDAFALWEIVV